MLSAGTKASAARYVGNGLGVVSVDPYGCNAPATPLQTWNIDLNGLYSVSGVVMNAIAIPSQGETALPLHREDTPNMPACQLGTAYPVRAAWVGQTGSLCATRLSVLLCMQAWCRGEHPDQGGQDGGRHLNLDRQQPCLRLSQPHSRQPGEADQVRAAHDVALPDSHRQ